MRVEGIQARTIVRRKVEHFRAGIGYQGNKVTMVFDGAAKVGRTRVMERLPLQSNVFAGPKRFFGPLHDDAPERRDHTLAHVIAAEIGSPAAATA